MHSYAVLQPRDIVLLDDIRHKNKKTSDQLID